MFYVYKHHAFLAHTQNAGAICKKYSSLFVHLLLCQTDGWIRDIGNGLGQNINKTCKQTVCSVRSHGPTLHVMRNSAELLRQRI